MIVQQHHFVAVAEELSLGLGAGRVHHLEAGLRKELLVLLSQRRHRHQQPPFDFTTATSSSGTTATTNASSSAATASTAGASARQIVADVASWLVGLGVAGDRVEADCIAEAHGGVVLAKVR